MALWIPPAIVLAFFMWAAISENPYAQGVQEFIGWKHDQTLLANPFSVEPRSFRYFKFTLPQGSTNIAMIGQFTASAEDAKSAHANTDNAVELYVLSEPAFAVWQNGYATSSVYETGRVSQATIHTDLPPGGGVYYLVFSNKFAVRGAKHVNATFLLRYKSWVPEWFRRILTGLWNWLGL